MGCFDSLEYRQGFGGWPRKKIPAKTKHCKVGSCLHQPAGIQSNMTPNANQSPMLVLCCCPNFCTTLRKNG